MFGDNRQLEETETHVMVPGGLFAFCGLEEPKPWVSRQYLLNHAPERPTPIRPCPDCVDEMMETT